MELQAVDYEAGGLSFTGYLADSSIGRKVPGVLVMHEGAGLTEHIKSGASELAALGYVAFAMDLFGGAPPSPDRPESVDRAKAAVQELRANPAMLRDRCTAALAVLQSHPSVDIRRLAAVGYCFGGAAAIELARTGASLAAIVGLHAGVLPGTAAHNRVIAGKVLLCHGADDPVVPPSQIHAFTSELTAAGVDWQLHLYGGVGHSFTNSEIDAWGIPGFAYNEAADRRARAAMLGLFAEVFGSG